MPLSHTLRISSGNSFTKYSCGTPTRTPVKSASRDSNDCSIVLLHCKYEDGAAHVRLTDSQQPVVDGYLPRAHGRTQSDGSSSVIHVESFSSGPAIALRTAAASLMDHRVSPSAALIDASVQHAEEGRYIGAFCPYPTVRVKIPGVSSELAYEIIPWRDTRPYDGLSPTIPQYAAGCENRHNTPPSAEAATKQQQHL